MRLLLPIVLSIVFVNAAACKAPSRIKPPEPTPQDTARVEPFPAGFDYPVSAKSLAEAITDRDTRKLRRHGWYLFAGINKPVNGLPLWRTWPTSTAAYAQEGLSQAQTLRAPRSLIQVNRDNSPANLKSLPVYPVPQGVCQKFYPEGRCPDQLPDGDVFQSNGDIMIAGVIYNEDAFRWIRGTGRQASARLFEAPVLTRMIPPSEQTRQLPAFPEQSFVLKHMYWPVPGDACGALPVWDNPTPPTPSTYMGYETWNRAVAVATAGCKAAPGTTTSVRFLNGVKPGPGTQHFPRVFNDARVVPLADFYHQTFTAQDIAALSSHDQALLDASAFWSYGRSFAPGDSIVSIATHIFTKEMPTWTMQSFWWHDAPDQGPYASDRPEIPSSQAPETWRHYLMVSEYGIPDVSDPASLPAHFNPYIELVSHPVATNCRNCHQRAGWPRANMGRTPVAAYQVTPIENDPGLLANLQPDNPIFKSLLLLDFQWALSDRAIPLPSPAPAPAPTP
ncbi:hypothetical protein [Corallococcus sp. 4LFB]|uniref:hypothetical protein n=1 Tax=Corallococcus sp. 4LFB TaxID=3383249 RepID=UPI00397666DE